MTGTTRWPAVLQISASCALIAGAIEAGVVAFRHAVQHQILWVSFDFWWMTPLAFLVLVVPAAFGVYLLTALIRRPLSLATLVGLLAGVLSFSILLPYSVIAWWASAALAAGIGMRAAKFSARRNPRDLVRQLGRIALTAACVMLLLGAGVRVSRAMTESRQMSALPAAPAQAPNVLLIVLDTVRAANMSVYGYARKTTPNLDRMANDATVFDMALSTAPWTLPSHGSLFTGVGARSVGGSWRKPIAAQPRTLAESLRDRGYATGGFVGNLLYTSYESGLSRGFVHYEDYAVRWPTMLAHSSLISVDVKSDVPRARSARDAWQALWRSHIQNNGDVPGDLPLSADHVAANFLQWQQTIGDRPFFAFLNFFDAHGPYDAPAEYVRRFGSQKEPVDRYDGAINMLDHVVGQVVDTLHQRGVLQNTLVIVTADHGEHFGEHELTGHANSLYLPLLHVPLIIRFPPAVPAGQRVSSLISLKDVAATVLDLVGADDARIPGDSLANHWLKEQAPPSEDAIAELERGLNVKPSNRNLKGDMYARFNGRYHYMRNGDGVEELYDYLADPGEQTNLINRPDLQAELAALRKGAPPR